MKRLICIFLSIAFITQSLADTVTVNKDANARGSSNFMTADNVLALIPSQTTGDVVDQKLFPSGNYGLLMKITSLGTDIPTTVKVGDSIWVYYATGLNPTDRVLTLKDEKNQVIDAPTLATEATANAPFSIQHTTNNAVTTAASANCTSCTTKSPPSVTTPQTSQVVSQAVTGLQKSVATNIAEVVPGEDELAKYMKTIDPTTSLDSDIKIARSVLQYCGTERPELIPLVLSIMKQESQFEPHLTSRAGAEGLMQLMPKTANSLAGVKKGKKGVNAYDPETSIKLGVKYIEQLLDQTGGDITQTLIAYNAGPGAEKAIEAGLKKNERRDDCLRCKHYDDASPIRIDSKVDYTLAHAESVKYFPHFIQI